jgi:glycosyltransferase involved in cell wall biosynthesis
VNLAILIGHFPPGAFGGAELQAEQWARRLARRHRVVVVTRRDPPSQPPRERRDGVEIIRLPVSRVPVLRTALDLRAIARALDVLSPRPDLLLCFQTFVSGLAGVRAPRRLGIPAVVWIRGEGEYAGTAEARLVGPRVWPSARGVLVQSEANRAALLEALGRAGGARARERVAARLEVVPNGLDVPEAPIARRGGRVLTIGRLIPEKGVDVVIDAVAGMQGLLTVAGDGPERSRLEARARHHGLDARFEGHVGRDRLETLFASAACVVLAARRGEGQPNVLLEAMARGLPVVATPVAGVADLIEDGVHGLLVPVGDPRALRDAIARLGHERGLAERLGAAARARVEGFAWDRVEPRLESLLERWAAA